MLSGSKKVQKIKFYMFTICDIFKKYEEFIV